MVTQSEASSRLLCVTGDEAMIIWPFLTSLIEKACSRSGGSLTEPYLQEEIANQNGLLWVYHDANRVPMAVAITQVIRQPDGQLVWFLQACGGRNPREWAKPVMQIMEAAALKNGASKFQFLGRPGWGRFHDDYSVHLVEFEKVLA